MIPVKKLIRELEKYPDDALVYAYEGEVIGIVIVSPAKKGKGIGEELGFIPASENDERDAEEWKRELARRRKTKR